MRRLESSFCSALCERESHSISRFISRLKSHFISHSLCRYGRLKWQRFRELAHWLAH